MANKSFSGVEIKSADKGQVSAVFATFNVIDKDGDVTLPGAFENGAKCVISAYGHKSWNGELPVGSGYIRTTATEAILEGQFFMDTTQGRDTFNAVKQLAAQGLGEWSYGYDVLDAMPGDFEGQSVQYLKRLFVSEVSPVLVGAGVNTRTVGVKSAGHREAVLMPSEYKAAIRPHETATSTKSWDSAASLKAISDDASVSELRSMFAWVDGDPELKSSYRMLHHSVDGEANIRACVKGIALLNSGKSDIPEGDRKAVYEHLASHLRDADREPSEFLTNSGTGLKLNDEMAVVLSDLSNLIDRTSEVVALRRRKGRTSLSAGSAELLTWLDEDLRRLKSLLNSPDEDAAFEYLRFIRTQLGE